jgi:transcriptional regulator of acetoin/glycerol metabolism
MSSVTSLSTNVIQARHLFFEEGMSPNGLVDDAVWRSWQRCSQDGRKTTESMMFNPVERNAIAELLEHSRDLITAAERAIVRLAETVAGTGYGVLLTDDNGLVLAAHGPIENGGRLMRQAMRPGVNLSERAIGTNAMGAALTERRAVGVFGAEHFFSQNQVFQCAASPIFDPSGKVVGSIDITRDSPSPQFGALSLVCECAAAIETSLFLQVPAFITVRLKWCRDGGDHPTTALLSFGRDGEVVAVNLAARHLIGLHLALPTLHYQDLFDGSFSEFIAGLSVSDHPLLVQLHSGLKLFAQQLSFKRSGTLISNAKLAATAEKKLPVPDFGDTGIALSLARAQRAVAAKLPVLITGETGTGKEVAARALHMSSVGSNGPFVAINCAAIPKDLIEGELFGYADGAYTGARRGGAKGKIEQADGGTLFLDEIGDMSLDLQTRLLRVLENREIMRLGESVARKINIQLISATHQDLLQCVSEHRFRQDLYFRINGFQLHLPPLRLRTNIATLIDNLLVEEEIAPDQIAPAARDMLVACSWTGNTRELRNALRFAKAMAGEHALIVPEHLPQTVVSAKPRRAGAEDNVSPLNKAGSGQQLKEIEAQVMSEALQEAGGNISRAAQRLGVSRSTLHRWLKKH